MCRFSANLLEAKRSGELESVVKAMDAAAESATAIVESAEKDVSGESAHACSYYSKIAL